MRLDIHLVSFIIFGGFINCACGKLRNKNYLSTHSHTPSIMDYAVLTMSHNLKTVFLLLELMPAIGDYDKWAIEWGYRYYPSLKMQMKKKLTSTNLHLTA
jgi:hypothetical protein